MRFLLVLACALGIAAAVWLLREEPSARAPQPQPAPPPRAGGGSVSPTPLPVTEALVGEQLLPRILPPDAAIEDIRDARAQGDDQELARAQERLERLARRSRSVREGIEAQITRTDDPQVRAIAILSLVRGAGRETVPWTSDMLASSVRVEDRLAALAALCAPRLTEAANEVDAAPLNVRLLTLEDTAVELGRYVRVPAAIGGLVRFLDAEAVASDNRELGILLGRVLADMPESMLLDAKGELRSWFGTAPEEAYRPVQEQLLARDDLTAEVRARLLAR